MALLPEILDRTPAEGARTVVLGLLAEARERADRLAGASDAEALHDFRVSVRRLRSTLRAWRDRLGESTRDKDLRRLRRVARATSEARNAEVLCAWVGEIAGSLPPAHRPAAEWLTSRLARTVRGSDLAGSVERFHAAADSLSRRLERESPPASTGTFAAALAMEIREQVATVEASLSRVETDDDAPLAHRARIEGKRLRYLLEPIGGTAGVEVGRAVRRLKRLQDLLGDLNDANLAAAAVKEARREGRPGAGLRPGLLALEGLAGRRARRLFGRLRVEVLESRGAATLAPSLEVASALEARARGS
jgi:CHAD domain-containing protein